MVLRGKKIGSATAVSLADLEGLESDKSEDSDYRDPPEGFEYHGSKWTNRFRTRSRPRKRGGREIGRWGYAVDGEENDAGVEETGSFLPEEGVVAVPDDSDHDRHPESTKHKESLELPATATSPPAIKSSSRKRKLSQPTTNDDTEQTPTPIQVVLFNPFPSHPFIVLGTYSITAETPRKIVEKSQDLVGFRGNHADPNDHVDGQVLIRTDNKGSARWEVVEYSHLHDFRRRYPRESKIRCLLFLKSDVRTVQRAIRVGEMEKI